ncbi:hypothetical protein ACIF8T_22685 [Streptomyces sp. NPDC085946]|uniref:hypothetical protein n=1 Tax=Streptomyces sp. NPDC085946 TaxID=3365744 RepID=UPI0037D64080
MVSARTPVRDLLLQAGRLGPSAARDGGPRNPLPGERARIRTTGHGPVGVQDVQTAPYRVDVV